MNVSTHMNGYILQKPRPAQARAVCRSQTPHWYVMCKGCRHAYPTSQQEFISTERDGFGSLMGKAGRSQLAFISTGFLSQILLTSSSLSRVPSLLVQCVQATSSSELGKETLAFPAVMNHSAGIHSCPEVMLRHLERRMAPTGQSVEQAKAELIKSTTGGSEFTGHQGVSV